MSWGSRRRGLYSAVVLFIATGFVALLLFPFVSRTPTCSDGAQNGEEIGVDCGGACTRLCLSQVRDPVVLWTRVFEVAPGVYTGAAYLENSNAGAGSTRARYTLRLFDDRNLLIAERVGETFIPPQRFVPIVEPNIATGNRIPVRAFLEFTERIVWEKMPSSRVAISDERLTEEAGRLEVTAKNSSGEDLFGVFVAAVLFDAEGVGRAASKSLIPRLVRGASETVVFTWPFPLPPIARIETTALVP